MKIFFTDKICNNETIGVYNHQRILAPNGTEDFLGGTAVLTDKPGKLKLYLDGIPEGDCKPMIYCIASLLLSSYSLDFELFWYQLTANILLEGIVYCVKICPRKLI